MSSHKLHTCTASYVSACCRNHTGWKCVQMPCDRRNVFHPYELSCETASENFVQIPCDRRCTETAFRLCESSCEPARWHPGKTLSGRHHSRMTSLACVFFRERWNAVHNDWRKGRSDTGARLLAVADAWSAPNHLAVQGRGFHVAVFDIDVVLIVPPFSLKGPLQEWSGQPCWQCPLVDVTLEGSLPCMRPLASGKDAFGDAWVSAEGQSWPVFYGWFSHVRPKWFSKKDGVLLYPQPKPSSIPSASSIEETRWTCFSRWVGQRSHTARAWRKVMQIASAPYSVYVECCNFRHGMVCQHICNL